MCDSWIDCNGFYLLFATSYDYYFLEMYLKFMSFLPLLLIASIKAQLEITMELNLLNPNNCDFS